MARYIDAENIDYTETVVGRDEYAGYRTVAFKSDIDDIPTAAVVPRAMIAEIFEEIEKVIGEQYENYVFDNLDIEGAEQDAIIAFVDVMKRHFAELKKKHTGEERNNR